MYRRSYRPLQIVPYMASEALALNHALVGMNILYIQSATTSWPDRAVDGGFFQTVDDHACPWLTGVG